MARLSSILNAFAFCTTLLFMIAAYGAQLPENHVAMFVFGDSLFDAGNNVYLNKTGANVWPYGETFFHHPTGRVCDGRILPDFIAQYAKLPFLSPVLQPGLQDVTNGVNFASAGAGVLAETYPGTLNIKMQLGYFEKVEKQLKEKLGDEKAKKLLSKAVYIFSIGGNDYISLYSASTNNSDMLEPSHRRKYMGMVLGNFTSVIQAIYSKGGRKFGFQNVGPLGCSPSSKAMVSDSNIECVSKLLSLAKLHNIAFANILKKLTKQLPGFKYSVFDYLTSLRKRIHSCSKYGFKEGKTACCGSGRYRGTFSCGKNETGYELCPDPNEYVWFDPGHPTEKTNQQLAELFWSGASNITSPYNLKSLFETL